ncbi:MAG TPA: CHASE2 domain-containing protein [Pyrinomonadaceae bacterium]|nr:CHASE2 domain-containing protein [Pyrinomonadaceae bacterium]
MLPRKGRKERLKEKGFFYWFSVVALIVIGVLVGHWLEKQDVATHLRYKIHQAVTLAYSARQPYVTRTVVVLIGDDEFWKSDLAMRNPTKRDYLARVVSALDKADASVIALDFSLRSPLPDGSAVSYHDYDVETNLLFETIRDVAKRRPVILPKTIRWVNGNYVPEADLYDGFDFQGGFVRSGYVFLPFDVRRVPLSLTLEDGTLTDSFAEAIVRSVKEEALEPVAGLEEAPYGSYLTQEAFPKLTTSQVLSPSEETLKKLRDNIVIVGGGWSRLAYQRGPKIDTHLTPVGPLPGALVHANFVEALLDRRTAPAWSERALLVFEVVLALAVAIIFALIMRFWVKLLALVILCLGLIAFSYLSWLNLGLFYDFFVPLLLVVGHATYEQARETLAHRRVAKMV